MSGISDGTAKVAVIYPTQGFHADTFTSLEAAGIQLLRTAAIRHTGGSTVDFVAKVRSEVLEDLNQIALDYIAGEELSQVEREVLLFTDAYQLPKHIVYDETQGTLGGFIHVKASRPVYQELTSARWHGWRVAKGF